MPSLSPKRIISGNDSRAACLTGVNALADIVGATLGPGGRNIILDQGPFQPPRSSRDGVTVAKHIHLADPIAELAAQLVYQAAKRAADSAGDGTSTATVLTQAIFREGHKLVTAGANPTRLKRGIDAAVAAIVGERDDRGRHIPGTGLLSSLSTPVPLDSPLVAQVGTLSANSDPALGQLLAAALAQVGKEGTVTVEESQSLETTLDVVEGMQFNQGYLSPYFITDPERAEAVLVGDSDSPLYIYLNEKRVTHHADLVPILTTIFSAGKPASLLVVAEDVTDSALALLVLNKLQKGMKFAAVKGPGFGDRRRALFDDLAVLTGATVLSPELGMKPESVRLEHLGRAARVTVTREDCTVVGGEGQTDLLAARLADLRQQLDYCTADFDRVRLEERLAKLTGGVAVVKVGGQTEAEMKERKDRAEDAMYATRAAVAEGIVPGGGTALLRAIWAESFTEQIAAVADPDEQAGWKLVQRAAEEPLRRIASNAGAEGGDIVAETRRQIKSKSHHHDKGWGWNAATGEFCDLLAAGVIDPVKVTRTALLAAGSIAGLLLTNEAVVADDVAAAAEVRKSLTSVLPGGVQPMLQY